VAPSLDRIWSFPASHVSRAAGAYNSDEAALSGLEFSMSLQRRSTLIFDRKRRDEAAFRDLSS